MTKQATARNAADDVKNAADDARNAATDVAADAKNARSTPATRLPSARSSG
jgi:hypothetical protein